MAEYKRMILYMYQYENGEKKKNVGYARVESRNGQCRVTLHMQLLGLMDGVFPTYMIRRQDNDMELIYLGDSILKNQVMDCRLITKASNIGDSGYGLSDVGGILLFLNEKVFYATQWDDKAIVLEEVLGALEEKKEDKEEKVEDQEIEEKVLTEEHTEEVIGTEIEEDVSEKAEDLPDEEVVEDDDVKEFEEIVSDTSEALAASNILEEKEWTRDYMLRNINKVEEGSKVEEEALDSVPLYKLPRGWKTLERRRECKKPAEEVVKEPVKKEKKKEEYKPKYKSEYKPIRRDVDRDEIKEHPTAEKLFNKYQRVYPFEDNEITKCVKIEPKDINYLPAEMWALSNNSFLLHGYYCYNHLIFGKLVNKYGSQYIIGVPGIYHNRERFMAKMFGFEHFKPIRKRELRQEDFGYWYIRVNL